MTDPSARVEPATLPWLEALAAGDEVFAARFGFTVVSGWCDEPATIALAQRLVRAGAAEWGVHLFFDEANETLVGNGGWMGAPVDGRAEIGYAVAPSMRGRGIATAAVRELTSRAARHGLLVAVAHTDPVDSASTTVLTRCGFRRVGAADAETGPVWRWERHLA